jgi:uncharacterized protein (DUF2236 family)
VPDGGERRVGAVHDTRTTSGTRSSGDEGYFPRGRSVLRRVHGERAVGLLYGQRSLLIGAIKPLNYVGTSEHTAGKQAPFRRLVRTARAFETIFFGTRAEADEVLGYVRRMHDRVHGELPDAAGPMPAGTPYSAHDGRLMLWTVAVMMDSAEVLYGLFVRRLGADEREALWQDYRRFALLFGTPEASLPVDYAAFRASYAAELVAGDVFLTPEAHHVGRFSAFSIPARTLAWPAMEVHDMLILGSLPPEIRRLYGLRWTPPQELLFRSTALALRSGRPLTPGRIVRGSNAAAFRSVEATERHRLRHGKRTPSVTG